MADETIVVDSVVKREHFMEFSTAAGKRWSRPTMLPNMLIAAVITGGGLLFLLRTAERYLDKADLSQRIGPAEFVMLSFMFGVLMALLIWALIARRMMTSYAKGGLREGGTLLGPRTYTLDAEGVRTEGPVLSALNRWVSVIDVTEATDTVFIWTDPVAAIIVPKAAIGDRAAIDRFMEVVRARMTGPQSAGDAAARGTTA